MNEDYGNISISPGDRIPIGEDKDLIVDEIEMTHDVSWEVGMGDITGSQNICGNNEPIIDLTGRIETTDEGMERRIETTDEKMEINYDNSSENLNLGNIILDNQQEDNYKEAEIVQDKKVLREGESIEIKVDDKRKEGLIKQIEVDYIEIVYIEDKNIFIAHADRDMEEELPM